MRPLISVIVPNRIGERNETLPTLKKQTYPNIEIIEVVDTENKGAAATRNKGALEAKGEYLFFCDNDLRLEKDCLQNLYDALQENKWADWAFGRFTIGSGMFNFKKNITPPDDQNSKEFIEYFHGVSTMSLIRASVKPKFDEDLRRYEDWALWITLTKAGHLPVFCDKLLFRTENRPHGISMQPDQEKWIKVVYKKHLKKFADIVIPHHDRHDLLKECLERIDTKLFNIYIVSGGTYAENCNRGAKLAETDDIIFLNDDTLPDNGILTKLAKRKEQIASIAQYVPMWRKTHYGIAFDDELRARLAETPGEVLLPSGFCYKVKKDYWQKLGGLNEIFKNGHEDIDLFLRAIKDGVEFGYIFSSIPHLLSKSEGRFSYNLENNAAFDKKWHNYLKKNMAKLKNRKINTDVKQELDGGVECEVIGECVISGERKMRGEKVILTREQEEKLRKAKCIA